jgi:hypothetical protein
MDMSSNMPRRPIKRFIWYCPICKIETYHRCVLKEFVACNDCDMVQHKPLKQILKDSK